MTDLDTFLAMLSNARVHHRSWKVNERADTSGGVPFEGTTVIIGAEDDGPYVEHLFDSEGKLFRIEPSFQESEREVHRTSGSVLIAYIEPDRFEVARTHDNHTVIESY